MAALNIDRSTGQEVKLHSPRDLHTAYDYQLRRKAETSHNRIAVFSPRTDVRSIYVEKSGFDVNGLADNDYVRVPFFDQTVLNPSIRRSEYNLNGSDVIMTNDAENLTLTEALNNTFRSLNNYITSVKNTTDSLTNSVNSVPYVVTKTELSEYVVFPEKTTLMFGLPDTTEGMEDANNEDINMWDVENLFFQMSETGKCVLNPSIIKKVCPEALIRDISSGNMFVDKDAVYARIFSFLIQQIKTLQTSASNINVSENS